MYFPSAKTPVVPSTPSSGKPDETISGKFDPTALERGAKALKELDSSPNATKAFEMIRLQEQTKQREIQAQIEQQQTQRQQLSLQRIGAESEEKRRIMSEQQEQERRTAQYKTQLESELYSKKMEDQQKQNEDWLRKQHEQFLAHEQTRKRNDLEVEEARRRTIAETAKHQRETEIARAQAESEGRIKQERENVDVHLRELRAKMAEERLTKLESINATLSSLGSGFNTLLADKARMTSLGLGLTGIALGVYAARQTARVAGNIVERNLGKPPLVRETSRRVWLSAPGAFLKAKTNSLLAKLPWSTAKKSDMFEKIVLEESLSERLQWTTNSLVNAKKNNAPFRHVLLYGPPGTGKTLFARTLARNSGLDYAVMTGGDVGPLGRDAVAEINKLFSWAGRKNSKGMVLFIDEADAFLRQGRMATGGSGVMSEDTRNALSAFLHHTGTENNQVMCILATNAKEVLDRAVLDRIDESFEFGLPALHEREQMIKLFIEEFLRGKIDIDPLVEADEFINHVAAKTAGFSGRQLSKLVLAWQSAVYGSQAHQLSRSLAESVLEWRLEHHADTVEAGEGPVEAGTEDSKGGSSTGGKVLSAHTA